MEYWGEDLSVAKNIMFAERHMSAAMDSEQKRLYYEEHIKKDMEYERQLHEGKLQMG